MEFNFEDPLVVEVRESYLLSVQQSLGADISARERFETIQELRVHLGMIALAEVELGAGPEEAMRSAVEKFGAPEVVSTDSKIPHKFKLEELKIICASVCIAAVVLFLTTLIVLAFIPKPSGQSELLYCASMATLSVVGALADLLLIGLIAYASRLKPILTAIAFTLFFIGVSVITSSLDSLLIPHAVFSPNVVQSFLSKVILFLPLLFSASFVQRHRGRNTVMGLRSAI